jgi:hypothetical protein
VSEPDHSKWDKALSALKAEVPGEEESNGSETAPSPEAIERIVQATKRSRQEWILSLRKSVAWKVLLVGTVIIGIAMVVLWNRARDAESAEEPRPAPIIPAPDFGGINNLDGESAAGGLRNGGESKTP